MKLPFFIIIVVLFIAYTSGFGQSPQSFKYQAIVRNGNGLLITNQAIGIRISILKSSTDGIAVYSETHNVPQQKMGLSIWRSEKEIVTLVVFNQ